MKRHHKFILALAIGIWLLILLFTESSTIVSYRSRNNQNSNSNNKVSNQPIDKQNIQDTQVSFNHTNVAVESYMSNIISEKDLCTHDGILHILSSLRRDCLGGKCDLDQLLNQVNSITNHDFLSLVRQAQSNKVTFFFKKGTTHINTDQLEEKIDQLKSILTTNVSNRKNTVAFIIAKASTTGSAISNRQISSQRAVYIHELIKKSFIEENLSPYLACNEIYRTYVGSETFQLTSDMAMKTGYISQNDIDRSQNMNEDLTEYINQSVILFTYPCFKEICQYMHDSLKMQCDGGDLTLPDECHEVICDE